MYIRPRAITGMFPDLIWQARTPIDEPERQAFRSRLQAELGEAKLRDGACEVVGGDVWSEREMARSAIRRTLERAVILRTRGDEFLNAFAAQQWQSFRRGHTCTRQRPRCAPAGESSASAAGSMSHSSH